VVKVAKLSEEFLDVFKSQLLIDGDELFMLDRHRMEFVALQLLLDLVWGELLKDSSSVNHNLKFEAVGVALVGLKIFVQSEDEIRHETEAEDVLESLLHLLITFFE